SIAWLYLCHAIFTQRQVDYRYWKKVEGRRRLQREDGEPKTWDLRQCLRKLYSDENDPVRRNVEFFIAFRNMIEHRHARMVEPVVAGRAQSLILNFEAKLTAEFGAVEGLGSSLRLPIFLSTLTGDAQEAVKKAYKLLPVRLTNFIASYDSALPEEIRNHPHYEFRLYLLPQTGPKSQADAALGDLYRATEVANAVQEQIPWVFNVSSHHAAAWQHHRIRPAEDAGDPTKVDRRYCEYVRALKTWLYKAAWIELLAVELQSVERFKEVTGRPPVAKPRADSTPSGS
ncbi:MAG: DUF3644 domain-containing protein, partial [Chloroflexi bacterium]